MKCFSSANGRARAMLLFVIASSMSGCCAPYILDESLPPRRVDEPYRFRLDADCWDAFWWMSGELPVGMSFGSDGVLKGTPRYAGRYFLTIGWDEVYEGEILTSVSKSLELVIVEAGEALPEWDPVEAAGPIAAVEERSLQNTGKSAGRAASRLRVRRRHSACRTATLDPRDRHVKQLRALRRASIAFSFALYAT